MKTLIIDYGFIIGMATALISLVASVTLSVAQRHKVRLALVFLIIGSLALSAERWVSRTSEIEKEKFEEFRSHLLVAIKDDVTAMRVTVNGISALLENVSLSRMGYELVAIEKAAGHHALTAFRKGSPDEWQRFSRWLTTDPTTKAAVPCLSLYVNSGNYYRIPLLLAYILTDAATSEDIKPIIQGGPQRWEAFPHAGEFFKEHGHLLTKPVESGDQRIGYILFYSGPDDLIGYADAMAFARELLVYQAIEKGTGPLAPTEMIFQRTPRGKDPADEIGNAFSSFRQNIIRSTETKTIVTQLIKSEQAEAIAVKDDQLFVIRLEKMIKLATKSLT